MEKKLFEAFTCVQNKVLHIKEKLKLTLYSRKILLITTNGGYKSCSFKHVEILK